MTIPIKLQLNSGPAFEEVRSLFDKIDSLEGSDLSQLESLRKQVQDKLRKIFESKKADIDEMVEELLRLLKTRITEDQG